MLNKKLEIISGENSKFWDDPCGMNQFKKYGFKSNLEFDQWYFDKYPYLRKYIPFESLSGKMVLEVGLGFGSIAQKLVENEAIYYGMDISRGPVELAKSRIKSLGAQGTVTEGNVLECPYGDNFFDYVISIGCLHHTGNLNKSIEELHRILKPGGKIIIMVYNAFSYRQWFGPLRSQMYRQSHGSPMATLKEFVSQVSVSNNQRTANKKVMKKYDTNLDGKENPFTEFIGKYELRIIMNHLFKKVKIRKENIGDERLLRYIPRKLKLLIFGPIFGLDLYIIGEK
jgi:ubiquinone/menaquinone biosynthesis C-methylase UbiE